jgi:hypothetical protein
MGGTLTVLLPELRRVLSTACFRVGWERDASVGMVVCTLLGPEGSERSGRERFGWPGFSDFLLSHASCVWWGECRPYVENYTVDASIFDSSSQ